MAGLLALVLAQAGGSAPTAPDPGASLAIWRLKPLGMDAATAGRLEGLLRAEAGRIGAVELQAAELTDSKLLGRAELQTCAGETACLCEIGRALSVDRLVTGVIGALGDDYTFDLKLILVGACREERRINEALSGREDLLIGAIRQALYKLVEPGLFVGSLSVEVPVADADVIIDGASVGRTPLGQPIGNLRPGVHRLQIVKPGLSEFADEVPVRFQQTTRVKVDLIKSVLTGLSYEKEQPDGEPGPGPAFLVAPAPAGPTPLRILAWSSAGLALAAAAAGGILAWQVQVAEQELEDAASGPYPYLNSKHQSVYERGEQMALGANVSWAVAGAAAAAAVVLFIVDATGSEAPPDERPEPAAALRLSPLLGPDGGGLGVRFGF